MAAAAGPISNQERLGELDVMRGFALLGVFIVHFVGSAFWELPLSEAQRQIWMAEPLHYAVLTFSDLVFQNKANTLFATLFGMGFWVMMQRLEARGDNFQRVYLRRLMILLIIGLINKVFLFEGDVLLDFAVCGFALFVLRHLPPRAMLMLGLVFALVAQPLVEGLVEWLHPEASTDDKEAVSGFPSNSYVELMVRRGQDFIVNGLLRGEEVGWWVYLLGRLLIGAWVIRVGLIPKAAKHLGQVRRMGFGLLALGLAAETVSLLVYRDLVDWPSWIDTVCHAVGAPMMAVAYGLLLVAAYHGLIGRQWSQVFAPIGRTALTSYVSHGAILTLIFYPFGFDLLGRVPPAGGLAIAVVLYVCLTAASHVWLARFRFGPLEYLWRWGTYGQRPVAVIKRAGSVTP